MIEFDWDELKNESNRKKHGIWFEEAQQVFNDPQASWKTYSDYFGEEGHKKGDKEI